MKKAWMIVLVCMVLSLVGCGKPADIESSEQSEETKGKEATGGVEVEIVEDGIEKIKERGKLIVATSADYPPYEFTILKDGKTEFAGFDIELAKKIAEELGVELEIRDMEFKAVLGAVNTGMADLAIAGLNPDPERTEVSFSDVYYHATHGVLIRKEDKDAYKTVDDLKNKQLGVQLGSTQEKMAEDIEGAKITSLGLITALIQELKTEKVDAIIMEIPVATAYTKSQKDLAIAEGIELKSDGLGSAIGVQHGNKDLMDKVNEVIHQVIEDGTFDTWVVEANQLSEQE